MEAHTLNQPEYATFKLQDGDRIEVGGILDKYSNMVEITGAIERPGKYAVGDRIKTVRDLVEVALGPTGDAYLQRALLYREQDDLRQSMESFDLEALLNNRIADIPLRKNDRLHIPSIFSLEDSVTVSVGGSIRAPGNYPFALNMRIEDAILQAGGLREEASTARIDVYRRINDPSSTTTPSTMSEVYTFTLEEGKIVSSDPTFVLQPFDQIVVRRSPGYEAQENVTVAGEILFGGRYAKKTRNERLSSLVERAGGLTEYAYAKGAKLLRRLTPDEIERSRKALMTQARIESDSTFVNNIDLTVQYVGIDLEKALKNPGGSDDIILREGDVLTVPQFNNTVKISGGVMYPNTVTYQKNLKLGGYIRQAGGYSRLAMKSKPFVIYANGKVATGRWARIEPGCEIVVPEKPDREPMSLQGILGISTSIASIALLISNLVK
jgi:protein involved in polysaccharide export with SLBB domain